MTRSQKFMYSTITSAIYQAVVMLVGFILPKVILNCYGSEINGVVTSITQFVSYLALVEVGLGDAAIYALYKPLADNDQQKISEIMSATNHFYIKSGILFVLLLLGLAGVYPLFVKADIFSSMELFILILILGINSVLDFFTLGKYRAILSADQKVYILSFASIIYYILNTTIIVFLSYKKMSIITVRAAAMSAVFIRTVVLLVYCHKNYPFLNYTAVPDNEALNKRWDVLLLQILGAIQKGLPVILATVYTSFMEVSIYSVYNMVMIGITGVLDIFISGLFTSFGNILAKEEKENLKKVYTDFEYTYYALITVIYSVAFLLIIPFVRIYTRGVNDIAYENIILGSLFVLNGYLYNLKTPQGMLVKSAGLYKETRCQTTIQALILAIFGVILGSKYGLIGIMIASCMSNIYRDFDLWFFIPKYVTKLSVIYTLKRVMLSLMALFFSVGGIYMFLNKMGMVIGNWGVWLAWAISMVIICGLIVGIISWIFDRKALVSSVKRTGLMLHIGKGEGK